MTAWLDEGDVRLWHGDCVDVMRAMPEASVDAIVTDPPYGIGFMNSGWDKPTGAEWGYFAGSGRRPSHREALDFQAFTQAWAVEALRILKPGGHAVAFGGTRTYHRMACAIEDAGFEIRDSLCWLYGSGFPKSKDLGEGRGTALKPAHEPIVLARKRLAGTATANVATHGTGALNIDACRIAADEGRPLRVTDAKPDANGAVYAGRQSPGSGFDGGSRASGETTLGRWPANVVLDEDAAAQLDAQSGERGAFAPVMGTEPTSQDGYRGNTYGARTGGAHPQPFYADSGGASRFFYCAKASPSERGDGNHHPTVKPVALMRWLVRLVTPEGGIVVDPFLGSGTTAVAARLEGFSCVGIERDESYLQIAARRLPERTLWAAI